ncbi:type I-E CRISPR-associated protein Cse1/CasA [Compostimonas suwonensis]|uniref:CRISPR system Cascade subunit CasA n=1 Tax=Compostimonas suwonensis TaxID=1048394 RepID=A0A2M9C3U4_9MICO|nr:type I-E CRISPR-associated protein Cse1/CasA [Compostimonas suwonensis]PJJ65182.1 CRISPR system Cascade subunit CasA [Compostimonas suwonensis]
MDDERPSFSLIDDPWILAEFRDSHVEEVSIARLFREAGDLRGIVGEVPTQTFAITRLLIAILHGSLRPLDDDPVEEWRELWNSEGSLLDIVTLSKYLDEVHDRFELFHGAEPFYQVASLMTTSGDVSSLDKLIADVPNGAPFFTTRLKRGTASISYAEAARWLIHCQAFDPSGIKSGAVDDPRVKGGKGYPIGAAWAGSLGGIVLEGRNLRETLLLNLVLGDGDGQPFATDDWPTWEREQLTAREEVAGGRQPRGPVDLLTWQSRRIRLVPSGGAVTGVIIANGDPLKPQTAPNVHNLETMTAWRRSETQEKALRQPRVYMPNEHRPERALWRGLGGILPQSIREEQYKEGSRFLPPPSLEWFRKLQDTGVLSEDFTIRTHAIGMEYGSQSATVAEIIDDVVSFDSVLISERGASLTTRALLAIEQTDKAVFHLGILARNLAIAAGGPPDGPGDRIREEAYFLLDTPFRQWLRELDASSDPRSAGIAWNAQAGAILRRIAREAVDAAGNAAWVGRTNPRTDRHVSSPEAFSFYLSELRKVLPDGDDVEPDPKTLLEVAQ